MVASRITMGLNAEVAMIAWLRPAEAASVPCSISVQVAMASILVIETDPEVRPKSSGTP